MTPSEQQLRGEHARILLENAMLKEALDAIEAEVVQQWDE